MIYRKSRLGIQIEPGSRNQLFQIKEGGLTSGQKPSKDSEAHVQYAILVRAFAAFDASEDNKGMSLQELEVMRKIDELMEKAVIMKDADLGEIRFYNCEDREITHMRRGPHSGDFSNTPLDSMDEVEALGRSYQACIEDHKLTKKEIELLKRVESVLTEASIKINPQTGDATITSPKATLDVSFSGKTYKYR